MENKNKKSHKRDSTLDNFAISSKKPRDENINLNFTSNPSSSTRTNALICSSSSSSSTTTNTSACLSSPSSSITTNALTCSSSPDSSSTCFVETAANLTLNIEYSSPKSSLTSYPSDVSQTSQDPSSQPRLTIYPVDKAYKYICL